jgi:hypothetical protein
MELEKAYFTIISCQLAHMHKIPISGTNLEHNFVRSNLYLVVHDIVETVGTLFT